MDCCVSSLESNVDFDINNYILFIVLFSRIRFG
jgi:hypothetical protein